jgi:riboflavin kinase/FMN adenylyltransferase
VKYFAGEATVPPGFGPSAVAIGKFDGVHRGHRAGLERLAGIAAERGLTSVVVTFDRHPLAVLAPERCPDALVSRAQRVEILEASPVDALLELEFTPELAAVEAERFVADYLVDLLGARVVLAGADFRFGHRGAGTVDTLRELGERLGFEVVVLDAVEIGGDRVSSTRIRQHLDAGEVRAAAELLGRRPRVRATVVGGDRIGREIGFPTANLDPAMEGFQIGRAHV